MTTSHTRLIAAMVVPPQLFMVYTLCTVVQCYAFLGELRAETVKEMFSLKHKTPVALRFTAHYDILLQVSWELIETVYFPGMGEDPKTVPIFEHYSHPSVFLRLREVSRSAFP